jgi:hypothetical protein
MLDRVRVKPSSLFALLLAATCATTAGAEAHAQARSLLRAGARIRLSVRTFDEPRLVAGTLLLFSRDSVTIVARRAVFPVSFALANLARIEVNRGRPRALVYGAPIYGALLGAWFGATALAPDPACRAVRNDECRWETSATVVGAAGGAVLFAMMVQLLVPEVWQDVPLTAFGMAPNESNGRRVAVGLAIQLW